MHSDHGFVSCRVEGERGSSGTMRERSRKCYTQCRGRAIKVVLDCFQCVFLVFPYGDIAVRPKVIEVQECQAFDFAVEQCDEKLSGLLPCRVWLTAMPGSLPCRVWLAAMPGSLPCHVWLAVMPYSKYFPTFTSPKKSLWPLVSWRTAILNSVHHSTSSHV